MHNMYSQKTSRAFLLTVVIDINSPSVRYLSAFIFLVLLSFAVLLPTLFPQFYSTLHYATLHSIVMSYF